MGCMMLGFVGYSAGGMFPLLNLFPWAIFWLGAVFFAAIPIPKSNKNS
jgi:hypothetical protein